MISVIVISAIAIISVFTLNAQLAWEKSKYDNFITASPVDLDQMSALSKYRSGAGHDSSGINVDGEVENPSSMKHYAVAKENYGGTTDQVKLFAPFDGTVARIGADKVTKGVGIYLAPSNSIGWFFAFGHVFPIDNLEVGATVKAGELVGYAHPENFDAFDLQLIHSGNVSHWTGVDSFMLHLTPELVSEYARYGLTVENLVISKEWRDQHPLQGFNLNPEEDYVSPTPPSQ